MRQIVQVKIDQIAGRAGIEFGGPGGIRALDLRRVRAANGLTVSIPG